MNRQPNQAPGTSLKTKFQQSVGGQFDEYFGRTRQFLQEFLFRAGRPVDTIMTVARQRYREGQYADAATRLRMVVRFQPANWEAWYLLGSSELTEGNEQPAIEALRKALALNPQHEESRFLLAVLDPSLPPEQQPKFAPLTLAIEHFEAQAADYDETNLYGLGYTGHEQAYSAAHKYLNPNYDRFSVLDLGCGTGLAGLQFRHIAAQIDGVDISPRMLAQAELRRDERERRVYDELHMLDLRRYLLEQPAASRDIILAANVFPYLGGLTPVFDGMARMLKPGGIASFSVEPVDGVDYVLIPGEGRFGHSEAYIREQAARVGLTVLEVEAFDMFRDEPGLQCVLRKPVPGQPQPAAPKPEGGSPVTS